MHTASKKFYIKRSNKTDEMSYNELRDMFVMGNVVEEKINDFLAQRLNKISSNDMHFKLSNKAFLAVHIIPVSSFSRKRSGDEFINQVETLYMDVASLFMLNGKHYTSNGLMFSSLVYNEVYKYLQFFRNGLQNLLILIAFSTMRESIQ